MGQARTMVSVAVAAAICCSCARLGFEKPARDAAWPAEAGSPDQRPEGPRPDHISSDLGPKSETGISPDIGPVADLPISLDLKPSSDLGIPPDLALDLGVCVEPSSIVTGGSCASQCGTTSSDGDGDCLDNARDPWPTSCNNVLLAEEFAVESVAAPGWVVSGCGATVTWECGQAHVASGFLGCQLVHGAATPIPSTQGQYLVETRFTVASIPSVQPYVALAARPGFNTEYVCSLDLKSPKLIIACVDPIGKVPCPGVSQTQVSLPGGTLLADHVLQLYHDGTNQWCRLVGGGSVSTAGTAPQTAGVAMLAFRANTVDVRIDYVRIFDGP